MIPPDGRSKSLVSLLLFRNAWPSAMVSKRGEYSFCSGPVLAKLDHLRRVLFVVTSRCYRFAAPCQHLLYIMHQELNVV